MVRERVLNRLSCNRLAKLDPKFAENLNSFQDDRRALVDWRNGLQVLFTSLSDIPNWLQFSVEERALVAKYQNAVTPHGIAIPKS